ncbi:MAG: tetraacyldisaccharide 4'-kinase [Candidatus Omnitrophota bacterium]|nr:tetraacyldisaccharide 4'-kinase [Candidatus Omnitrophota bacterium]
MACRLAARGIEHGIELELIMKAYLYSLATDKNKSSFAGMLKLFLLAGSFFYHLGINFILFLYRSGLVKADKLNCKVISVGNITWGGTGKTPIAGMLTEKLTAQGRKVAVLTRGYGGDECRLLKNRFADTPVLIDKNRLNSGRAAVDKYEVDAVILDDGFQYRRIKKDIEIVVINSLNPFGNGYLIPRGILREPLKRLKAAGLFFLTKTDLADRGKVNVLKKRLKNINPDAVIVESVHKPFCLYKLGTSERAGLADLKGKKVATLSAIGDPQSFQKTVRFLGAEIACNLSLLDHHRYRVRDIKDFADRCRDLKITTVITTEKDSVKLQDIVDELQASGFRLQINFFCLAIQLEITGGRDNLDRILEETFSLRKSILILDDGRPGHLKQSLAAANFVGQSVLQIKKIKYKNRFFRSLLAVSAFFASGCCRNCLRCLQFCLDKDSYIKLTGIKKRIDVVISAGSGLVPVNIILARARQTKNIVLMKPGPWSFKRFDLIIVPEHDKPLRKENVLVTKGAPNLVNQDYLKKQGEELKQRVRLSKDLSISLFIGGDNPEYNLLVDKINRVVNGLLEAADNLDAELLVTTSRRTSKEVSQQLKDRLANQDRCRLLIIANEANISGAVEGMLGLSQIVVISYDSVSMISEALAAAKYVIVFELDRKKSLNRCSKHGRLVNRLANENYITVTSPEQLHGTIEKVWREKKPIKVLNDNLMVKEAVNKLLNC